MTDDHDPPRPHSHLIPFPEALETLLVGMRELRAVLGAAAAPGLDAVEERLREALAAHRKGRVDTAVARVGEAMDRLATLGGAVDPAEGAALRALAERFRRALGQGALGEAKEAAEFMRVHSGSLLRPKKER